MTHCLLALISASPPWSSLRPRRPKRGCCSSPLHSRCAGPHKQLSALARREYGVLCTCMHASHPFTACRTPSAGAGPLSIPVNARPDVPPRCAPDHGCTHFRSGPATHWVLWGDSWLFEYVLAASVSTVPASSCTPVVLASGFRVARSDPCAPAPSHQHPLP